MTVLLDNYPGYGEFGVPSFAKPAVGGLIDCANCYPS